MMRLHPPSVSVGLRLRAVMLLVAVAVLLSGCVIEDLGPRGLTEIKAGECFVFDGSTALEFDHVKEVPCSASHDGEVLGNVAFAEEEYPEMAWFNGVLANKCSRVLEDYFEDRYTVPDGVWINWIVPTEESWDGGFHSAICYGGAETGKTRGRL